MKRLITLILIILIFFSLTENKFKGGVFKTTDIKSIDQKVIELRDNGAFIAYQIKKDNRYSEGDSVKVVFIKTGKWIQRGELLIIKGTNPVRFHKSKKFINVMRILDYYKEVCSQRPLLPILDGPKDKLGKIKMDTINIINYNSICYRKEIYNR